VWSFNRKKENEQKSKRISFFSLNSLLEAFLLYDIDQDGFINHKDLFTILKMMVGNNLDENELNEIVKDAIKKAGRHLKF
jgi:Ca2+-binding EF-hand superfamily protein